LAIDAGYKKIAVISGVGVQEYYETAGYAVEPGQGEFLMKNLSLSWNKIHYVMVFTIITCFLIVGLWFISFESVSGISGKNVWTSYDESLLQPLLQEDHLQ